MEGVRDGAQLQQLESRLSLDQRTKAIEASWQAMPNRNHDQNIRLFLNDKRFIAICERHPAGSLAGHLKTIRSEFQATLKRKFSRQADEWEMENLWHKFIGEVGDKQCLLSLVIEIHDLDALQAALEACCIPYSRRKDIEILEVVRAQWKDGLATEAVELISAARQIWSAGRGVAIEPNLSLDSAEYSAWSS